eukprot:PhF_6_TR43351/c0_g2_i1/m.66396
MERCVICLSESDEENLFRPCLCKSYVHRKCLREWRHRGQNLRAYTHCPTCAYMYRVVTVTMNLRQETKSFYYSRVARLWLLLIVGLFATIAGFAGFSYLCDTSHKNVPVVIKYALSSVVHGLPSSDDIDQWRDDFHKKDVHVWPYYTLLGILCTSITILLGAMTTGINDQEYNQLPSKRRQPTRECDCCTDTTVYSNNPRYYYTTNDWIFCYC